MIEQNKYRELCLMEKSIPLFSKDWWLDAVCGNSGWEAVCLMRENSCYAAMPYTMRPLMGFAAARMPVLTPMLKIWIQYTDSDKLSTRLSFEHRTLTDLISRLPRVPYFHQKYHYTLQNWLPFYWQGYSQSTRYTYILELKDTEILFSQFQENIRREIRKAQKRVRIYSDNDLERFFFMKQKSNEQKGRGIGYNQSILKRIDAACASHDSRKLFFAEDEQGHLHGALYLVWDEQCAYYLIGCGDIRYRNSGAGSALMWEAIQYAASRVSLFDFEGSMIASVERFFRSFGARPQPYFEISRANLFFKLLTLVKS
jgi:hypothetical protein